MKIMLVSIFLKLFLISTIYLPTTSAQYHDITQFSLPDGVKARLGGGRLTGRSDFSLDGTMYAKQKSIGLWLYDVHSGIKEVALLSNHLDNFTSIAVSSNGKMLVSRNNEEVSLWEIESDNKVAILTDNTEEITTMQFSPDSKVIAVASEDDTIRLWSANTGKLLFLPLKGHVGDVISLGFSPDSTMLASGSSDKTVRLWSVATGEHLTTLEEQIVWGEITQEGHTDDVTAVSFSPDGNTLASGGADKKILLWDINAKQHRITVTGHTDKINAIVFSPDGTLLVSGSTDETIRFWKPTTGEHLETLTRHTDDVVKLSYSSDGAILASIDNEGVVHFWDGYTGQHLDTRTLFSSEVDFGGVHDLAYVQNGTFLYSGKGATRRNTNKHLGRTILGRMMLWNTRTGEFNSTLSDNAMYVASITLSPDGKTLVAVGQEEEGKVEIYKCGCWGNVFICYGSGIKYCRRWKVTARRYPLKFWNVQTGEHLLTLTGHTDRVSSSAFSPDGKILATGSWDNTIRIWNPSLGQSLITYNEHRDIVNTVVFSPDGQTLASGSDDNTIKLWSSDGTVRVTLNGHAGNVNSLAYTPDGKILASGSSDGTIRLWDPITDEHIGTLEGHSEGISSITFSVDGGLLASASLDNTIRLWDPTTRVHLKTFIGHKGDVNTVAFSPDGTTLASGSSDGTILLWEVDPAVSRNPADVNGDGVVSILDLVAVASNFGQTGQNPADVNGDRVVNVTDIVLVAAMMEAAPAAPSMTPQIAETLTVTEIQKWITYTKQLQPTDATRQRGIAVLEQLLVMLMEAEAVPLDTALLPNYPNPFNPETWIPYQLVEAADVTMAVYAADGRLVRTLALGYQRAGVYRSRNRAAYWDGRNDFGENVASGVYFYTLTAGEFTATRKMLILK